MSKSVLGASQTRPLLRAVTCPKRSCFRHPVSTWRLPALRCPDDPQNWSLGSWQIHASKVLMPKKDGSGMLENHNFAGSPFLSFVTCPTCPRQGTFCTYCWSRGDAQKICLGAAVRGKKSKIGVLVASAKQTDNNMPLLGFLATARMKFY